MFLVIFLLCCFFHFCFSLLSPDKNVLFLSAQLIQVQYSHDNINIIVIFPYFNVEEGTYKWIVFILGGVVSWSSWEILEPCFFFFFFFFFFFYFFFFLFFFFFFFFFWHIIMILAMDYHQQPNFLLIINSFSQWSMMSCNLQMN